MSHSWLRALAYTEELARTSSNGLMRVEFCDQLSLGDGRASKDARGVGGRFGVDLIFSAPLESAGLAKYVGVVFCSRN